MKELVLLTVCCLTIQATSSSPIGAVLDVGRIANGAQASLGEFPYVASVQLRNEQHLCGGFIYNEFYVVTAASCLAGKTASEIQVVVGTVSLITHSSQAQEIAAYQILVHSGYNAITKENDIAIIRLANALLYNSAVQPIYFDDVDSTITTSITMGWGATMDNGIVSVNLRKTTLNIKDAEECASVYGAVDFDQNYMICAGSGTSSPCNYDEGSPLVQNGIAIGIMSKNKGCLSPYKPTVYTRLSAHYDWLIKVAGQQPPMATSTSIPTTMSTTSMSSTSTEPPSTSSTTMPTTTIIVPTAPCNNCIPPD